MPAIPLQFTSVLFLILSVLISIAARQLARAHLSTVERLWSGQTHRLVKKLARASVSERLGELHRQALPETIEWRIADEALQVDETQRAFVVDSILADVALELESRAMWPRAAVRLAAASGVLLMALAIALHLEVYVAVLLLLMGIASAILCMTLERRASSISIEIRRNVDALIDVLALRHSEHVRGKVAAISRHERRSRRR